MLLPFTHVATNDQVPDGASVGTVHLIAAESLRAILQTVNVATCFFTETRRLHRAPNLADEIRTANSCPEGATEIFKRRECDFASADPGDIVKSAPATSRQHKAATRFDDRPDVTLASILPPIVEAEYR